MSIRVLAAVLTAIGLPGVALAQGSIKLGVVNVDTGPLAVSGAFVNDGATYAVESLNAKGGALGRKYELLIQNQDGKPASAIEAAKTLVEDRGVTFFTGLTPSGASLAIESKLPGLNALFIDATAASNDLTGKGCTENYFRIGVNDGMQARAFVELAKESGIKSWNLMMADIAVGHDSARVFAAAAARNGAKVKKTLFAPIAASDLGSYINQLVDAPAEGLFMYYPSSAGIALIKQQAPLKLFEKYMMVLSSSMVNEILIGAHNGASVGLWSAQSYFWTLPGDANGAFVKGFEARFHRKPTYIDADAYLAFELVHEAILKAGAADVAKVRAALAGLKSRTIIGDVEMRAADHQLLRPLVVVRATKADGGKEEITLSSELPREKVDPAVSPACKM